MTKRHILLCPFAQEVTVASTGVGETRATETHILEVISLKVGQYTSCID
jgi:hypothetical protein